MKDLRIIYEPYPAIEINGIRISFEILEQMTRPDPKRWFNYIRKDNDVIVTCETRA